MSDLSRLIFETEIRHFHGDSHERHFRTDEEKSRAAKAKAKIGSPEPNAGPQPAAMTALKAAVLEAALPHAAFDGFTDKVLEKAGQGRGRRHRSI